MLKASFHIHIRGDHDDYIPYSGFELLDHAHALGFDVIAFTCHERVIATPALREYAESLGILLIPGIELNIGGHVLVLNADENAHGIDTPEKLRQYREKRPEIFTIAAHPFFPHRKFCLHERIYEHLDLFDAIEHSWFYSPWIDWNKKGHALAQKHRLPYLATSDVHELPMLNNGHVLIDSEPNIASIFKALRTHRFESVSKPQGVFEMWWKFAKMNLSMLKRYLPWTPPHFIFDPQKPHEIVHPTRENQSRSKPQTDRLSGGLRRTNSQGHSSNFTRKNRDSALDRKSR